MNAPAGPALRDIHMPPAPSWWPPAPGWWLLAIVLLALVAAGLWMLAREWRERRWRRRVVGELDRIAAMHAAQPDPQRVAVQISELLRRAALLIEPRAATLHGEDWLAFLDRQFEDASGKSAVEPRFLTPAGRTLIDAPYRRFDDPTRSGVDAAALLGLARGWLRRVLPRSRRHV
jgi:Domain of unknown function (DUF4381)